jgi:hypothetical protein
MTPGVFRSSPNTIRRPLLARYAEQKRIMMPNGTLNAVGIDVAKKVE